MVGAFICMTEFRDVIKVLTHRYVTAEYATQLWSIHTEQRQMLGNILKEKKYAPKSTLRRCLSVRIDL